MEYMNVLMYTFIFLHCLCRVKGITLIIGNNCRTLLRFPQTYMTGLYTEKPVLIIPLSIKHFYIHPALSLASGDWGNNPTFLRLAYLSIYQGGKVARVETYNHAFKGSLYQVSWV